MRILVVEDDEVLQEGLKIGLELEGVTADVVGQCEEADTAVRTQQYDAVVLDIALPDGSGLDLLGRWRREGLDFPVLLLTARTMIEDRVDGLDAGADDYLGKPFALTELAARIRALARRRTGRAAATIVIGDLSLDVGRRTVKIGAESVALSRREFAILYALAERPGHILSRTRLEDKIYGWQEEVESNAIEVHIHNLRAKISRSLIETVRGEGYRIVEQ
jgi:two-component system response regulator QseB